ncbi:MAG: hypothetical protein WBB48_09970 [Thermodesulfobacteriota bacterium]
MDKWPEGLREDMEEVFKSHPALLETLTKEKEFEDLMNKKSAKEHFDNLSDELAPLNEIKDKDSAN